MKKKNYIILHLILWCVVTVVIFKTCSFRLVVITEVHVVAVYDLLTRLIMVYSIEAALRRCTCDMFRQLTGA